MENSVIRLSLQGLHCASCVENIEKTLKSVSGVQSAEVNFATRMAEIQGNNIDPEKLINVLKKKGYKATELKQDFEEDKHIEEKKYFSQLIKKSLIPGILGIILLLDMFFQWMPNPNLTSIQWSWIMLAIIVTVVMIYSGGAIYRHAWISFLNRRSNMDTLIALGTATAWLYSVIVILFPEHLPPFARHIYFDTAVLLLAFINFGNALEIYARGKTSEAIRKLIGLQPRQARVIRDSEEIDIPIDQVKKE